MLQVTEEEMEQSSHDYIGEHERHHVTCIKSEVFDSSAVSEALNSHLDEVSEDSMRLETVVKLEYVYTDAPHVRCQSDGTSPSEVTNNFPKPQCSTVTLTKLLAKVKANPSPESMVSSVLESNMVRSTCDTDSHGSLYSTAVSTTDTDTEMKPPLSIKPECDFHTPIKTIPDTSSVYVYSSVLNVIKVEKCDQVVSPSLLASTAPYLDNMTREKNGQDVSPSVPATASSPGDTYSCSDSSSHLVDQTIGIYTSHTGDKPYNCEKCQKTFSRKHLLARHIGSYVCDKTYTCAVCMATFSRLGSLNAHTRTEAACNPYRCRTCGKVLSGKKELIEHNKIHTGD
jgi:hypothetical protein